MAVAWTLAWPITAAIVGARSPQQVDGWLAAAAVRLDAADLADVRAAIERTGAGAGPSHRRQPEVPADAFPAYLAALEARHRAELTFAEIRRALQALSSLYVERRVRMPGGDALAGAGKRAAFALYYGPLHFLLVREIVRAFGRSLAPVRHVARPRLRHGDGRRGLGPGAGPSSVGRRHRHERLGRGRGALDAATARAAR